MKTCIICNEKFGRSHIINGKKIILHNRNKCLKCLPYIPYTPPSFIKINCKQCNKEIIKNKKEYNLLNNYFCSRSCAAIYNNKMFPKRPQTHKCKSCGTSTTARYRYCELCRSQGKHLKSKCRNCDTPISNKYKYCSGCRSQGKHLTNNNFIVNNILQKYFIIKGANRYSPIRDHARKVTGNRLQKCIICGYDRHIETCHIKEIKEFSPDTKIGIVNDPSNLVLLCPNHHWELDHKYFSILK